MNQLTKKQLQERVIELEALLLKAEEERNQFKSLYDALRNKNAGKIGQPNNPFLR